MGNPVADMRLAPLTEANRLLDQVRTVEDVSKLVSLAEAARIYAREAELGLEAQNYAAEIKVRAQRKGGEILREMDKHPAGRPVDNPSQAGRDLPPKLAELEITYNDSSRWQQIAQIPDEVFEQQIAETKTQKKELTTASMLKLAKQINIRKAQAARSKAAQQGAQIVTPEGVHLIHADFYEAMQSLPDASIDVIVTDPPYPKEYLPLYEDLAAQAARVLRPGGSMLVMVGQSYLPEILRMVCLHLHYHWTAAYLTPGGQAVQLWQRKVNTFWKPLLWFVNGEYVGDWVGDVCRSDVNDNDKTHHDWGQSESGMVDIVNRFTRLGDVVLDPFCGAGTTGVAALRLGRKFIGIDNDEEQINITRLRLGEVHAS